MNSLLQKIWAQKMNWLPMVLLLVVLVVTWLVVPKQDAPFVYQFF